MLPPFIVLALATLTVAAAAAEPQNANCALAPPIEAVATYAQVPLEIRNMVGDMAERGQPFQVSDAIDPKLPALPTRRLLRAGHRGGDWFLLYERGGVARYWQIAVFRVAGVRPRVLADAVIPISWKSGGWTSATNTCRLIEGALAGRIPPYPPGVSATTYF